MSLVCEVKNGLWGAAGLSHQPPSLFYPSHLPLYFFTSLVHISLFLHSRMKSFSFSLIFNRRRDTALTHTVNTARHSAELSYHSCVYSYSVHLLWRWLINELENTTTRGSISIQNYSQLCPSGLTHTHLSNTQMKGYLKDNDTMPNDRGWDE